MTVLTSRMKVVEGWVLAMLITSLMVSMSLKVEELETRTGLRTFSELEILLEKSKFNFRRFAWFLLFPLEKLLLVEVIKTDDLDCSSDFRLLLRLAEVSREEGREIDLEGGREEIGIRDPLLEVEVPGLGLREPSLDP